MVKGWVNLLRGKVTVTAEGAYLERLLNLCGQAGVTFWGTEWRGAYALILTTRRSDLPKLRRLAERIGCTLVVGRGEGLPFLLGRMRTRYAFLAGLCGSVLAVAVLSNFVLSIEVRGNEGVPAGEILSELRMLGLRTGVYAPALDRVSMANEALTELDGLSWMGINRYGTRIEVVVRERAEPPELRPTEGVFGVYATADGLIEKIEPEQGNAVVGVGDIVARGDLLITGAMELLPPEYSTDPSRWMYVAATGEAVARTWRTLEGEIPLCATIKEYAGGVEHQYDLRISEKFINIFGKRGTDGEKCDKIVNVFPCAFFGIELPIALVQTSYQCYTTQSAEVDLEGAQTLVEAGLIAQLTRTLGEEGELLSTRSTANVVGDILHVTVVAECREQIGAVRPMEVAPPMQVEEGATPPS